jgi:LPS export ABC transporter protein LptC
MTDVKRKLKIALTLLVVMGLAAAAVGFFHLRRQGDDITAALPKMAAKASMYLAGVHQTATQDGAVQWELNAGSAELESESGRMILKAPEVEFILDNGSRVRLTADTGVLNTKTNDIEVRGNVCIKDSRYTLTTEMLAYEHEKRVLYSTSPVHIAARAVTLNAATMRYDLNTSQALFSGMVKGRLNDGLPL